MHFKLFFSCFVLGACTASLLGQKFVSVSHDGSYIQITSENGMKVNIAQNKFGQLMGLKHYDVMITGPSFMTKTLRINDQLGADILTDLFMKHQGVVDDMTFENILNRIENYVEQGVMDSRVYFVLQMLNHQQGLHYMNLFFQGNQGMFGTQYGRQGMMNQQGLWGMYGGMNRMMNPFQTRMMGNEAAIESVIGENQMMKNMMRQNQMTTGQYLPYSILMGRYGMDTMHGQNMIPSVWNKAMFRTQMPFMTQKGDLTMNRLMNNKMMEQQMEIQMENQMEQQLQNQMQQQSEIQMEQQMMHEMKHQMQQQNEMQMEQQLMQQMQNQMEQLEENQMQMQMQNQMQQQMRRQMHKQMQQQMQQQLQNQLQQQMRNEMVFQMGQQMENQLEQEMNTQTFHQVNQGLKEQMKEQFEREIEREVEREMSPEMTMQHKMPFGKRVFIKEIEVAPTTRTMGVNNQFWDNFMRQNQMQNMLYGQTPMTYNRIPMTQGNMFMRMMRMPNMMMY